LLAALVATACRAPPRDDVFVKGSDTMHELLEAWKKGFEAVDERGRVVLARGGSSAGLYALLNGLVDFAASSRPMTEKERRAADRKGLEVLEMEVACDGIEVIVHPANPVGTLTMAQLADIFAGTSTSWRQVGGPDVRIDVLNRDDRSGTRAFFRDHVLEGRAYAAYAKELPSTEAVVDAVARDRFSIGYVGMGASVEGRVALVRLRSDAQATAVLPSPSNVAARTYPLARSLYLYAVVLPDGAVERFLDHVFGPEGQQAVEAAGFAPIADRPHR
jgi:phosphate transport system substrate-binding protein